MARLKRTISVSKFTARLFNEVAASKTTIIVTRRGKPIAQIIPFGEEVIVAEPGLLKHLLIEERDIISPIAPNK